MICFHQFVGSNPAHNVPPTMSHFQYTSSSHSASPTMFNPQCPAHNVCPKCPTHNIPLTLSGPQCPTHNVQRPAHNDPSTLPRPQCTLVHPQCPALISRPQYPAHNVPTDSVPSLSAFSNGVRSQSYAHGRKLAGLLRETEHTRGNPKYNEIDQIS